MVHHFKQSKTPMLRDILLPLASFAIVTGFLARYELLDNYKIIVFAVLIGLIVYAFRRAIMWHGTELLITDEGIECIERFGFIKRVSEQVPWEKMSSLGLTRESLLSLIFKHYTIQIFVIGRQGPIVMRHVMGAQQAREIISRKVLPHGQ